MHASLRTLAATAFVAAFLVPGPVRAQNFFEQLFGIGRAAPPPVPPAPVPGPTPGAPGGLAPEGVPEAPRPAPAPPKPVVIRAPSEDSVLGQDLLLNGLSGSLKVERAAGGLTARMAIPGTKISQPAETCTVPLGNGAPVTLADKGRPEGAQRFEMAAGDCPLRLDLLDGSVLVTPSGEGEQCTFKAADCSASPKGLWGPGPAGLLPRSAEFDSGRGSADRAVRENYKVMTSRVRGSDVRPIVTEQAAFSADREQLCRGYAREGAHGYCHLRFTEARALSLAARLGQPIATGPTTASVAPRPRRPRPAPDPMQPVDSLPD
jgi:hypothetical protein